MRRYALIALACTVVAAHVTWHASVRADPVPSRSDRLVVDIAEPEQRAIAVIDANDCRDKALAGEDTTLAASDSRVAREGLESQGDLVARYCACKFNGTKAFLTKGEMIRQWLSTSAPGKDGLSAAKKARYQGVAQNCALKNGLPT